MHITKNWEIILLKKGGSGWTVTSYKGLPESLRQNLNMNHIEPQIPLYTCTMRDHSKPKNQNESIFIQNDKGRNYFWVTRVKNHISENYHYFYCTLIYLQIENNHIFFSKKCKMVTKENVSGIIIWKWNFAN